MTRILPALLIVLMACAAQKPVEATSEIIYEDGPPAAPEKPVVKGPPATRKSDVTETIAGVELKDPYRWLEGERSPQVQEWMKAQDKYARDFLKELPNRAEHEKRMRELLYVESTSAPVKRGNRYFYEKQLPDREKRIVFWREGESGEEKVLLDPNKWSKDGTISLGRWEPSWDGKYVAFQQKPNAADEATLRVAIVDSGSPAGWSKLDQIEGAKYATVDWTPDNRAFYYEKLPTDPNIPVADRPGYTEVRLHQLGSDPEQDTVVREKTGDPKTFLDGELSRDGKYLFVTIQRGWAENDILFKRLDRPDQKYLVLAKGKGSKYGVEAWNDNFYIITDEGAPKQRIFKVAATRAARKNWKEIIPEDQSAALVTFAIVGNHIVAEYLKNASSELRVFTLDGKPVRNIPLPSLGTTSTVYGLQDQDDAYFEFSSFTTPKQVYRTSMKTGKTDVWAKSSLTLPADQFEVTQVRYPSKDGTEVTMFLVHKKGLEKNGQNKTLLYGYGGFDVSLTPTFKSTIYHWLEQGGVYAMPNLRGGGEYGQAWHEAGMLDKKQNTFDDFIAAAEWLVQNKITSPQKLAIYGGSNGGLLVGAAMTQRPELYGAVVCAVPLLDMVRYHLFGSGKTWIPEYGSVEDPKTASAIVAYSPYHKVAEGAKYPPLLMLASDRDDRVDPMHARKFVAAVQNATTPPNPNVYLRVEENAGHGGADQLNKTAEQSADLLSFLDVTIGGVQPQPQPPAPAPAAAPATGATPPASSASGAPATAP